MHLPQTSLLLITLFTTINAFTISTVADVSAASQDLFKRKGGGGRGGGGGFSSGGGSRGGGTTSSGGSSGGRTGSTGGVSGSRSPSYAGGRYYGGGAATPYRSGTARGGISPVLLGAGVGAGLFAAYAYGAYVYDYDRTWTYYNETSNEDETHPVECACARYADCGCDASNDDQDYINQVANDDSISMLADINGTQTLVINGTVGNATDGDTLPGAGANLVMTSAGWVAIVGGVAYSFMMM